MHALPHAFSRSIIGKARLLKVVKTWLRACFEERRAVSDLDMRLTVWFPKVDGEDSWPIDDNGERMEIDPFAVAKGEVKGARLKLDGVNIGRQAVLDIQDENAAKLAAIEDKIDAPFVHNGKNYGLNARALVRDLSRKIESYDLDVRETLEAHGYEY